MFIIVNRSSKNEFVVVHNGIISNHAALRTFLESKGCVFRSETDTECIPVLLQYLYSVHEGLTFVELVQRCVGQLEGTFAIVVKSRHFPNEAVASRRGSSLLIGVKSREKTATTLRYYDAQLGC